MSIPNDPMMLLSYVNTQLRDFCKDLDEMCKALGIEKEDVILKLKDIDYEYDSNLNKFV